MTPVMLPKKVGEDVKRQAKNLGISEKDFVVNAARYYTELVRGRAELHGELRAWSVASDMDLMRFEETLSQ